MKSSFPEITVIVPVFNAGRWLRRCVDSVLAQSFTDFELLLIDDGSTDISEAVCDEYARKDKRVRVFHKPNGGVSSARNLGLDNAHGKWIIFVDSDDMIRPEMLRSLSEASVGNEIVFFSLSEILEDSTRIDYIAKECTSVELIGTQKNILYLKDNDARYPFFGYTWSKMFRLDIIDRYHLRFINGYDLFEDEIFTDEYCKNITHLRVLSLPLYYYRRSSSGLTGKRRKPENLLVLSRKLLESADFYVYGPLKVYEMNRSVSFFKEAIDKDEKQEFYDAERLLFKEIELRGVRLDNGLSFRIMRLFGRMVGVPLMRLSRSIKGLGTQRK